jgi:hypothetical protein
MKPIYITLLLTGSLLATNAAIAQTAAQRFAQQKAAQEAALKAQQQKLAMERHFAEIKRINDQAALKAQKAGAPTGVFTAMSNAYNLNNSPAERARQQAIAIREQKIYDNYQANQKLAQEAAARQAAEKAAQQKLAAARSVPVTVASNKRVTCFYDPRISPVQVCR